MHYLVANRHAMLDIPGQNFTQEIKWSKEEFIYCVIKIIIRMQRTHFLSVTSVSKKFKNKLTVLSESDISN